jgi:hypothetical protein
MNWLTDLTTADVIQLAIGVVAVLALLVTAFNAWIAVINERKRTQPVVIAHEAHPRRFTRQAGFWAVGAYATNEGGGPAFNVRFGVEFHGVRYPYKLRIEDPDSGNIQRVIRSDSQCPPDGHWPVLIDSTSMWTGEGDPDPSRVYWARYENAQGHVWETRNPANRSDKLDIRRVRFVRLREWREERKRVKAGKHGREWELRALAELRAGMTVESEEEPPFPPTDPEPDADDAGSA